MVTLSMDERTPLVPQCEGCIRAGEDGLCKIYLFPEAMWRAGKKCCGYIEPMKTKKEQNKNRGTGYRRVKNRSKRMR